MITGLKKRLIKGLADKLLKTMSESVEILQINNTQLQAIETAAVSGRLAKIKRLDNV